MTTLRTRLEQYLQQHTDFYVVASDHKFSCNCLDCLCFLAFTGLDLDEEAIKNSAYRELMNEDATTGITNSQRNRLVKIAGEYL